MYVYTFVCVRERCACVRSFPGMHVCSCCGMYVEVRGKLRKSVLFFHPVGPWNQAAGWAGGKHLTSLLRCRWFSHPSFHFEIGRVWTWTSHG